MKKYEKPDLEVMNLYTQDIITTSPDSLEKDNQTNDQLDGPWAQ